MRETIELYLREYGKDFRKKRLHLKMSQSEVAQSVGVSQAIISHIETGRMLPSFELEKELLNVLTDKEDTNNEH